MKTVGEIVDETSLTRQSERLGGLEMEKEVKEELNLRDTQEEEEKKDVEEEIKMLLVRGFWHHLYLNVM